MLTRLCCCCGLIVTKLLPFVEFANLISTWASTWSRLQSRNKVCMMHPRSCLTPSVESTHVMMHAAICICYEAVVHVLYMLHCHMKHVITYACDCAACVSGGW